MTIHFVPHHGLVLVSASDGESWELLRTLLDEPGGGTLPWLLTVDQAKKLANQLEEYNV